MESPALLIVGQTPPPWHGQAVATQILFDESWDGYDVGRIRMAYSTEMDQIGRFRWSKLLHLFSLIRQTRDWLLAHPRAILFYPPASPQLIPFLRDLVYLLATRPLAGRIVFIYHAGGLAEWASRSKIARCLARLAYGKADLSLEVAVENPSPHALFEAKRWKWTPCGVEVPPGPVRQPAAGEPCRVLFVGSLQEGKGVLEIIKTAACFRDRGMQGSFRFIIVGRWFSQEFEQRALSLANELGVDSCLEFTGQLTGADKWRAYAEADVFFFPTHYASEASPIVLIEALGSGLPVVTTRWRGIPSLMKGCDAATLCDPKDTPAFADALQHWADRRFEPSAHAGTARAFYEQNYLPERFVGRIKDQLKQLVHPEPEPVPPREPLAGPAGRPIRILQVFNQYLERGGEEIWVNEMARICQGDFEILDLRFHSRAWKGRGAPNVLRQARLLWDNPEARRRLRQEVLKSKPDVLVFHNLIPVASLGLYAEARQLSVPVIQFAHNFRPFSASGTLWVNGQVEDAALRGNPWPEIFHGAWEGSVVKTALLALYLRRLRKSRELDAIASWITVSDFMRDKFVEAGVPAGKVASLRHCWHSRPANSPRCEEQGYYLFLGRLVPEKGINVLLDAWAELYRRLESRCPKLVIAGVGPEEARVHRAIAGNERVTCVGFVDGEEKAELLAGCRALIAPSIWWEPLGLIIYEAYEYARPVLASGSGGLQETVQQGVTGFLHPAGDVMALADDVVRIEGLGPEGRRAMGEAAKAWLLEQASPALWKKRFREIIERHISRRTV